MAGGGIYAEKLKPHEVEDFLVKGSKFIRWDEVSIRWPSVLSLVLVVTCENLVRPLLTTRSPTFTQDMYCKDWSVYKSRKDLTGKHAKWNLVALFLLTFLQRKALVEM